MLIMKRLNIGKVAKGIGKVVLKQARNPYTYIAAGAAGLGVGLASKEVRQGVMTGINVAVGIIGYAWMSSSQKIVDEAIEQISNSGE
jgi:hypothetical protein